VRAAHDVSDGGLAVTLAESTFGSGIGAQLRVPLAPTALFSESQARAVVAVAPHQLDVFLALAGELGVPATEAGETGGERLRIEADGATLDAPVERLRELWATALPKALGF